MKFQVATALVMLAGLASVGCEEKSAPASKGAGSVIDKAAGAVDAGAKAAGDAAKAGAAAVSDAAKAGTDAAKNAADATQAAATDAAKAAGDALTKLKEQALAEAPKLLETAQTQITGLKDKVAKLPDAVKPAATSAQGEIEKTFNSLKDQAGGLKDVDTASLQKTWDDWKGKLTGLNDSIKKFTEQFKL